MLVLLHVLLVLCVLDNGSKQITGATRKKKRNMTTNRRSVELSGESKRKELRRKNEFPLAITGYLSLVCQHLYFHQFFFTCTSTTLSRICWSRLAIKHNKEDGNGIISYCSRLCYLQTRRTIF